MKDGLYHLRFKSNQQDFGVDIITIKDGKVNGGDPTYFYQGDITKNSALLRLTRFSDQTAPLFGAPKEFHLELRVKHVMGYHILEGHVQGKSGIKIQIHIRLLAPLA